MASTFIDTSHFQFHCSVIHLGSASCPLFIRMKRVSRRTAPVHPRRLQCSGPRLETASLFPPRVPVAPNEKWFWDFAPTHAVRGPRTESPLREITTGSSAARESSGYRPCRYWPLLLGLGAKPKSESPLRSRPSFITIIGGSRERAVNPSHNSLGPLHGGANERLRAWTRPAIVQIFRRF